MPDLSPTPEWSPVPQLETSTFALGGPGGPMNSQAQALLNRTEFLLQNSGGGGGGAGGPLLEVPRGFTLSKRGVIVPRGESGFVHEALVESPMVFFDERRGRYMLVVTAYSGTPSAPTDPVIAFVDSDSLLKWPVEYGLGVLYSGSGVPGEPDRYGASAPFVMKVDDTYHLFFLGHATEAGEGPDVVICHATSPDTSSWELQESIYPGGAPWRDHSFGRPWVVQKGQSYYLFFSAAADDSAAEHRAIGCMVSSDLLTWEDLPEPVVFDAALAGMWDGTAVMDPCVFRTPDGWAMAYTGLNGLKRESGLAVTTDAEFPGGWRRPLESEGAILTAGTSGAFDDTWAGRGSVVPTPTMLLWFYTANDGATPPKKEVALAIDFGANKAQVFRGCKVYRDGTQTVNNSSATAISFASEDFDTDGIHGTTNLTRLTIPQGMDGRWEFRYKVSFAANATGMRSMSLRKNGSADANVVLGSIVQAGGISGSETHLHGTVTTTLEAGDYVELYALQNSGGSLAVGGAASTAPGSVCTLEAQYLG